MESYLAWKVELDLNHSNDVSGLDMEYASEHEARLALNDGHKLAIVMCTTL